MHLEIEMQEPDKPGPSSREIPVVPECSCRKQPKKPVAELFQATP